MQHANLGATAVSVVYRVPFRKGVLLHHCSALHQFAQLQLAREICSLLLLAGYCIQRHASAFQSQAGMVYELPVHNHGLYWEAVTCHFTNVLAAASRTEKWFADMSLGIWLAPYWGLFFFTVLLLFKASRYRIDSSKTVVQLWRKVFIFINHDSFTWTFYDTTCSLVIVAQKLHSYWIFLCSHLNFGIRFAVFICSNLLLLCYELKIRICIFNLMHLSRPCLPAAVINIGGGSVIIT